MRYLLLAVGMILSADAASADWNEVMDALARASGGTRYDVGADPAEPSWVATRKARFEGEREKLRAEDLHSERLGRPIPCRKSSPEAEPSRCE